jgi:hypothetical protein
MPQLQENTTCQKPFDAIRVAQTPSMKVVDKRIFVHSYSPADGRIGELTVIPGQNHQQQCNYRHVIAAAYRSPSMMSQVRAGAARPCCDTSTLYVHGLECRAMIELYQHHWSGVSSLNNLIAGADVVISEECTSLRRVEQAFQI